MKKLIKLLLALLFGSCLGYILWLVIPQKEEDDELFQEEM